MHLRTFPSGLSDTLYVGKVVYTHAFGQGLVFLNTAEACADLLDKRGTIYSDKPHLVMCGELYVPTINSYPSFMSLPPFNQVRV